MKYIKNSIVQDILVIRIVKIETNFMTSPVLFNFLLLAGNLKVGKPMLCCLFLSNSTQIHSKEAFIIKHEGYFFLNMFFRKLVSWEQKGNFKCIDVTWFETPNHKSNTWPCVH